MMGQEKVFFFPSSYRRAVKYGQRDAANEIHVQRCWRASSGGHFLVVTYPDALAELVVAKQNLDERILKLTVGQQIAQTDVVHTLRDFNSKKPIMFMNRASLPCVEASSMSIPTAANIRSVSTSSAMRLSTIRTFDVETQLAGEAHRDRNRARTRPYREQQAVFPQFPLRKYASRCERPFFLRPHRSDSIPKASSQSLTEQLEGATEVEAERIRHDMKTELNLVSPLDFKKAVAAHLRIEFGKVAPSESSAVIPFNIAPQPLFHKNFDLLCQTLEDFLLQGYTYIYWQIARSSNSA